MLPTTATLRWRSSRSSYSTTSISRGAQRSFAVVNECAMERRCRTAGSMLLFHESPIPRSSCCVGRCGLLGACALVAAELRRWLSRHLGRNLVTAEAISPHQRRSRRPPDRRSCRFDRRRWADRLRFARRPRRCPVVLGAVVTDLHPRSPCGRRGSTVIC